jgi:hypothetical protein
MRGSAAQIGTSKHQSFERARLIRTRTNTVARLIRANASWYQSVNTMCARIAAHVWILLRHSVARLIRANASWYHSVNTMCARIAAPVWILLCAAHPRKRLFLSLSYVRAQSSRARYLHYVVSRVARAVRAKTSLR